MLALSSLSGINSYAHTHPSGFRPQVEAHVRTRQVNLLGTIHLK